jgi:hypothetical protein
MTRRRYMALAAVIALIAACANQQFITVKSEPKDHAWWLRSDIRPFGSSVRGVPVPQLRVSWCKVNEFSVELFPPDVRSAGDSPLDEALKRSGAAFFIASAFGKDVNVLVGVYETCANERGTFLMAVDLTKRQAIDIVEFPGKANFAVLHPEEDNRLQIWWCFECDNVSTFRWNSAERRFEHEPEPADEEDGT